jgi:formate dehydrogenase iron-sulfur subunit
MGKGMLIDTTRCQGCRGCQVACKQWNLLPGVVTSFSATQTNPPSLNASTYNIVEFHELEGAQGDISWHFAQKRCLHCLRPRCVATCPVDAIVKLPDGAVVVDREICDAVQACECPFGGNQPIGLLTFDLEEGKAFKCTFCWDRQEEGLEPACARTCPSNAIEFGERDELIVQARARIQGNPDRYYNHIYGEFEAGGTSIMYLTAVAPVELGFPVLGSAPLDEVPSDGEPSDGEPSAVGTGIPWGIPAGVAGFIAAMGGLLYFRARRAKGKVKS